MKKIAITGGIASGKSTLCEWLRTRYHFPVFDADAAVHRLYHHPLICQAIALLFPECMAEDGSVNRLALGNHINYQPDDLEILEALFHPLIRRQEILFWKQSMIYGYKMVFSDIPLLFETRSTPRYDAVIVADAPAWLRQKRAMQRTGMTEAKWRSITHRQVDDATRTRYADFLLPTSIGKAHTMHMLQHTLTCLKEL